MRKMGKYLLFLIFLFGVLTGCNQEPKKTPESLDLCLMTYNIRNGRGMDDSVSLERTAAVINRIAPDAVAVQEIDSMTERSGHIYVLGKLAELTGMKPFFASTIDFDGGKYGIGMLCQEEPLGVKAYPLPGREEARALLVVEFKDYQFACTHLSLTEDDRLASINILNKLDPSKKPLFIAGDWNDTPSSLFLKEMEQRFLVLSDTMDYTFPASEPNRTIDYLAVLKSWKDCIECRKVEVVNAPIESDHRPIVAEISILLNKK